MVDEMDTDDFQIPINKEETLINKILDAKYDAAIKIYGEISKQLFTYNYNEVMFSLIHLMYNVYTSIVLKYSNLKEEITIILKNFMADLQTAEISSDIDILMKHSIENMCERIDDSRNNSNNQNKNIITQSICEIIEKEYSNNAICLSFIAEKLGLSPNYIGHIFKSVKNISIAQYIMEIRMEKLAYYLNNTSLPLDTIIENVGLNKNNYFYTLFKKHFGMSLSEYKLTIKNSSQE